MTANGHGVSLEADENILKLDCSDGCKNSVLTLNCILKWVNFIACKFINKAEENVADFCF